MRLIRTKLKMLSFSAVLGATVCSIFILLCKMNYEQWNYFFKYQRLPLSNTDKKYKLILLWTPFQGSWKDWSGHVGQKEVVEDCDTIKLDRKCRVTTNKEYINFADVVLFSLQDLKQEYISQKVRKSVFPDLPWRIRTKQLWIAIWYESNQILQKYHYYSKNYLQSLNDKFNGTITHRDDSLIPNRQYWQNGQYAAGCHYKRKGDFREFHGEQKWQKFAAAAVNKSRLVSWIVSHCNAPSGRDQYVARMKERITIDIYGRCGSLSLNTGSEQEIMSQYKFYLAFENSKCPNYVTEKLHRVLNQDMVSIPPVPVVLGPNKTWYEENFPNNSFINVDDFDDPESVAEYLDFLDKNSEEYMKYLEWRKDYLKVCEAPLKCQLCQKLLRWSFDASIKGINDFESFWEKGECQTPVANSDTEASSFLILHRLYWSLGL